MNLSESINALKGVPDQALQHELVNPSGLVPSYLVLAEAQRRQLMRQAAQKDNKPSGSVYDDVIRNLTARQPPAGPPAPVGMVPPSNAQPSGTLGAPGGTPPQNFQTPRMMAEGGEVDDSDDTDTTPAQPSVHDYLLSSAKQHNIDPALAEAMMQQESSGNVKAVSPKGARGPMQLMPPTARSLGVDIDDPYQNIDGGMSLMRQLLDKYGDTRAALAAYNYGEPRTDKVLKRQTDANGNVSYTGLERLPDETRNYIKKITSRFTSSASSPGLLPSGPMTIGDVTPPAPIQAATQMAPPAPAQQPTLPPAPALPPPDTSGLAAVLSAPGPAPAPPQPIPAAAPAAAAYRPPTMDEMLAQARRIAGPAPTDPALHAELARLQQEAQRIRRPNIWETLQALGSGMASSRSPFWGQALGAGVENLMKTQEQHAEQARQLELATMGISEKLDDKAQQYQKGLADLSMKAMGQAQQHQLDSYNAAAKVPGAIAGKQADQALHPGWEFVAHPYADLGVFVPPGTRQVTPDIKDFLVGNNPATGKPWQVGDDVGYGDYAAAGKLAQQKTLATEKQRPTIQATRIATAVDQLYNNHPELTRPLNPDGSSKDPTRYTMGDAPPELQSEANYNAQLSAGMTKVKAEAIMADPAHTTLAQRQEAQGFLDQDAKQTGNLTGARIAATNAAEASILTPEALDMMSEAAINGKPVPSRNAFVLAQVYKAAGQKLKDRGMTAQGALMEANAAKASQAALVDITKLDTNAEAFSKTAEKSMEVLEKQAKTVEDLGAPIFNTPLREFEQRWKGDTNVAGFRAALLPAQAEIARVLNSPTGAGVLSDDSRREMQSAIGEGATYAQIHRALDVFRTDMANKRDVYRAQMEDLKPKTVVGGTAQTPAGAGAPPQAVTAKWQVGDNTLKNGQVWRKFADGHVEQVK